MSPEKSAATEEEVNVCRDLQIVRGGFFFCFFCRSSGVKQYSTYVKLKARGPTLAHNFVLWGPPELNI